MIWQPHTMPTHNSTHIAPTPQAPKLGPRSQTTKIAEVLTRIANAQDSYSQSCTLILARWPVAQVLEPHAQVPAVHVPVGPPHRRWGSWGLLGAPAARYHKPLPHGARQEYQPTILLFCFLGTGSSMHQPHVHHKHLIEGSSERLWKIVEADW